MKSTNRLEKTWSPSWNLGLQDEFGFCLEVKTVEKPELEVARPNAWALASREVLNRQSTVGNRLDQADGTVSDVVTFLENLCMELADDE